MPSGYAHYRFGAQLLPDLPPEVRRIIRRHRNLYDVGLHGPDLFLYYDPARENRVAPLSDHYHYMSGQVLFSRVCKRLRLAPSEPALAYLYGLLAHYCLDALCHPFVFRHTHEGPVGHLTLETEFDRYLLDKDGKRPAHAQDCSRHIRLNKAQCATAAEFYPQITGADISRCTRNMSWATWLLVWNNPMYRKAVDTVLRAAPKYAQLVMSEEPNPLCAHLDADMEKLYEEALALYPKLLAQISENLQHGIPLGKDFAPAFDIKE